MSQPFKSLCTGFHKPTPVRVYTNTGRVNVNETDLFDTSQPNQTASLAMMLFLVRFMRTSMGWLL